MSNETNGLTSFHSGETNVYKFIFNGIDITGWKIHLILKDDLDENVDPVMSVFSEAGWNELDDPVNGLMYLTVNSEDSNIPPASYHYQFIREIGNETPRNLRLLFQNKVKVTDLFGS